MENNKNITVSHMDTGFDTELTNRETERLALLLEECGEVQQIIGKILRHGYFTYSPFDKEGTTNKKLLCKEVADILVAINLMIESNDISKKDIDTYYNKKIISVNKYLHFNEKKKYI